LSHDAVQPTLLVTLYTGATPSQRSFPTRRSSDLGSTRAAPPPAARSPRSASAPAPARPARRAPPGAPGRPWRRCGARPGSGTVAASLRCVFAILRSPLAPNLDRAYLDDQPVVGGRDAGRQPRRQPRLRARGGAGGGAPGPGLLVPGWAGAPSKM